MLGRELSSVIIVDNSPTSYIFHASNAIPIDTWVDDQSDRQLGGLLSVLRHLAGRFATGVFPIVLLVRVESYAASWQPNIYI